MLFMSENPVADAEAYYNYLEDNQPEEEENPIIGYCAGCGEPIAKEDDYIEFEGETFCLNCKEELVEYIVEDTTAVQRDDVWQIRSKTFRIGADVSAISGDITYVFSTSLVQHGHMEKDYFDIFVAEVEEVSELIQKGAI